MMKHSSLSLIWFLAATCGAIIEEPHQHFRRLQDVPSAAPSAVPSAMADEPTAVETPTTTPADEPTATPAEDPTAIPVDEPSATPSAAPSGGEVPDSAAPSGGEVPDSAAPSAGEVPDSAAPSAGEVPDSAAPSAGDADTDEPSVSPVAESLPTATPNDGINFYDEPEIKWATTLTGSAVMGQGNGFVRVGELVYATSSDGTLTAFDAGSGMTKFSFAPEASSATAVTRCYGQVFYAESAALGNFIVLGISEIDGGDLDTMTSMVYALDAATGDELWKSEAVPGKIQGTPVVTQNPTRISDGVLVVATHNTGILEDSVTSTGTTGHVSVWNGETGTLERTLTSGADGDINDDTRGPVPYGEIAIIAQPDPTANWETTPNPTDVMMWVSAATDGTGGEGQILGFQIPFNYMDPSELAVDAVLEVRWSGLAPPALFGDAQGGIFSVRGGAQRGWVTQSFNDNADWRIDPLGGGPVRFAATYNGDESVAFIATSGSKMAAVDSATGDIAWERDTTGTLRGPIVVSPDGTRVYSLGNDGRVEAMDAETGTVIWSVDCDAFPVASCRNVVDGSLALSDNGLVLYYGDRLRNVRALQLGFLGAGTEAPTTSGTAAPVTATDMPSMTPVPSAEKVTEPPSMAPSLSPSVDEESPTTPAPVAPTPQPATFPPTAAPSSAFSPMSRFALSMAGAALASFVLVL